MIAVPALHPGLSAIPQVPTTTWMADRSIMHENDYEKDFLWLARKSDPSLPAFFEFEKERPSNWSFGQGQEINKKRKCSRPDLN